MLYFLFLLFLIGNIFFEFSNRDIENIQYIYNIVVVVLFFFVFVLSSRFYTRKLYPELQHFNLKKTDSMSSISENSRKWDLGIENE